MEDTLEMGHFKEGNSIKEIANVADPPGSLVTKDGNALSPTSTRKVLFISYRTTRFSSSKMLNCDTVSSFCGRLILTNHVSDSKNGDIPINISILRFDTLKEQTINYLLLQTPPVLESSRYLKLKFLYHNVFEVIDLETNLKHLYILFVLKSPSDKGKLFVKLFRLIDFKTLKQQLEFELKISVERFDGKRIHVLHGPIICYANLQDILIFNKDGKVKVVDNVNKFVFLDSKCIYNRQLKYDQLHVIGTSLDYVSTSIQARDAIIIDLLITFAKGELQVRPQPLIFNTYASIIKCLLVQPVDDDNDCNDVLGDDVVVATSQQQLILFKNGDLKMATDLPFGDASRIMEFCSSPGSKYFLVTSETNTSCCIVKASNFEIMWTLTEQSDRWSVHVDDFIGYGSHQVMFLRIPSNQISSNNTHQVLTVIDDIIIDGNSPSDPNNWKYFLNNFSGIQFSNHLSKKEKELFGMHHDKNDDECIMNAIPNMVLDALDEKFNDIFLRLEETKKEKHSKMKVLRDVHRSITSQLSTNTCDSSISHDLVNLLDDNNSSHINDWQVVHLNKDEMKCLEVVDELWQAIFMDKWIMALHIRNNSKDKKIFNMSLNCLKISSHIDTDVNGPLENVETHSFKLKSTEMKLSNVDFILEFLASQKSSQNEGTQNQNEEHVCSEDREYLKVLLPRGDECFVVCSVDVPILIDSSEISCVLQLHWNEVKSMMEDAHLDFLGDIHFASNCVMHAGIVRFNSRSFEKLLFDPKSLNIMPIWLAGKIYAVFGSTLNSTKLQLKSSNCNNLLAVVTSIFLDKLKFIFICQCGFFWSDESSYLNKCAVFITKALSNDLCMTMFHRNNSQLAFLIDEMHKNFRGNLVIAAPPLLNKSELKDKIYENLKKERLLMSKTCHAISSNKNANSEKGLDNTNENDDFITLRMRFKRKRKRMEASKVQKVDDPEECKMINSCLVECMRQTDRAVSFLFAYRY